MTTQSYGLDGWELLLAAVVKQAIADVRTGTSAEQHEARRYLAQIGLLDESGAVVQAEVADVSLVWIETA